MFASPPVSMHAFGTQVTLARDATRPRASDVCVRTVTFTSWVAVHGLTTLWLVGPSPMRFTSGDADAGLLDLTGQVTSMPVRGVAAA